MRRIWLLAVVAVAAAALAGFSLYQAQRLQAPGVGFYGTMIENPPMVSDLTLASAGPGGQPQEVSLADYQGKLVLVFFGYTHCPDVCPLTMARLAHMYQELGEPDDLQVVMISVDPQRDTPAVMRDYVQQFDPSFVGLTGTPAQISEAARTFFIGYNAIKGGGTTHTDAVALLDRHGRMRMVYGQPKLMHLQDDLQRILAGNGW
ncbi:MAG TPA: SCO family protein [Trueperaceae bacterium]